MTKDKTMPDGNTGNKRRTGELERFIQKRKKTRNRRDHIALTNLEINGGRYEKAG